MSAKSLLVVSAGLNAVLIAGLAYMLTTRLAPAPPPPRSTPAANAAAVKGAVMPAKRARPPAVTPVKPGVRFDWRLVESDDYRQYIANLRAIGCPEETIRDIIIADVNKLFQSRWAGLGKPAHEFKYWQTRVPKAELLLSAETLKQQHELDREKRALLKELLGVDAAEVAATGTEGLSALRRTLSFLSPEKRSRVLELEVEFNAKMARAFSPGAPDPEDTAERQRLGKEKAAELAKVLTPQELEDYELRMSQTAQRMHIELDEFDATEKEFRDIFKLHKKFDEEYGTFDADPADADSLKRWGEARKELDEQIKQVLGESRYQEYERAQDPAYKRALMVAERQGLGPEVAQQVWDLKQAAEAQAGQVRADPALSEEQRKMSLRAIQAETQRAVVGALGQPGLAAYQKQVGGGWLRGLDSLTAPKRMETVIIAPPGP